MTCAIGERQGADLLLDTAVRASKASGTPLRLVSLVALDPMYGSLRGDEDAARERALAHAFETLDIAKALPEGFPVTATIVDGPTVEEAVKKLEWHDGDLIMVGSSRLSAPRRLFLGSTAAKMLRVLEVPMVVVPREEPREERCHNQWTRRPRRGRTRDTTSPALQANWIGLGTSPAIHSLVSSSGSRAHVLSI